MNNILHIIEENYWKLRDSSIDAVCGVSILSRNLNILNNEVGFIDFITYINDVEKARQVINNDEVVIIGTGLRNLESRAVWIMGYPCISIEDAIITTAYNLDNSWYVNLVKKIVKARKRYIDWSWVRSVSTRLGIWKTLEEIFINKTYKT